MRAYPPARDWRRGVPLRNAVIEPLLDPPDYGDPRCNRCGELDEEHTGDRMDICPRRIA
jgi:hypothetical protein